MGNTVRVILVLALILSLPGVGGCSKILWTFIDLGEDSADDTGATIVVPPPQILFIYPSHYPIAGNDVMNLQGFDFQNGARILVDGVDCTNVTWQSNILISGTVPSHAAGTADVQIVNPDGQGQMIPDAITYTVGPIIRALAPSRGTEAGGTNLIITGFNFQNGATVDIGGTPATGVSVINPNRIQCVTPTAPLGAATVRVTNPDTLFYDYNYFIYTPAAPNPTAVTPNQGTNMGGNTVTVTGSYFQNGATVIFGTVPAASVTFVDSTTLTVIVPNGPHAVGPVDVIVRNPDNQTGTLQNGYTFIFTNPPPTITTIVPDNGPGIGGTTVIITGTGFLGGASVAFGNYPPNSVTVNSTTQITVITGSAAGITVATPVTVTVTNPDTQSASVPNGFTYVPTAGNRTAAFAIDPSAGVDLWLYDFQANIVRFRSVMVVGGIHSNGADPLTDAYAEDWLQAEILSYMSQFFLRNSDGTKVSGTSYNICFVGVTPGSPWIAPPAQAAAAQAWQYNIMHLYDTDPSASGALGRASLDFTVDSMGNPVNGRRENNSLANQLGIFMTPIWTNLLNWGRVATLVPALNSTDRQFVDGSYYLGKGTAQQDARFTSISNNMQNFADGIATVGMHENGHSVGLVITSRNNGNHCTVANCPMQPVASWGNTTWCTGASSCASELANALGMSP